MALLFQPLTMLLLLFGIIALRAQRLTDGVPGVKVVISVSSDSIVMTFKRPNADVKLQGFILGYGLSSNQLLPLPQDGAELHVELDAEPNYLVAVQPITELRPKKHCTGQVNLQQPPNLLVVSVLPSAVLLSWGETLKTSNIWDECLEDGFFTVRYREKDNPWVFQSCPVSDTVVNNLKPDTLYEFNVRANKDEQCGVWSKPVLYNTKHNKVQKAVRMRQPMKPRGLFPPRQALHNHTRWSSFPAAPRSSFRSGASPRGVPLPRVALWSHPQTNKPHVLKSEVELPPTVKPTTAEQRRTSSATPTTAETRRQHWEDSDLFQPQPSSDVDALGKKRYVAPHVVYQTGKKPDEPCSISSSLSFFPEANSGGANLTTPPTTPPTNLTVVTVEGCPSFVILDWEKTDTHTTEYEVISTTKGPDGEKVSILTTNQTHTAVENLKPESSYEFKVKPKNERGAGPSSEPVAFKTESADPRVSDNVSGKDAIWTKFPFQADSYSDCRGAQFVKRTWYRKFVGVQLCNSLRYKIYLSDSLKGKFYNIGDESGFGEDHCQFVDSFLDGRTGQQLQEHQQPTTGFYRAVRQEPVNFGPIGGRSRISYVSWYECGIPIPGKW
ncbi:target of Nesh-SH3-like isoform X2 [Gouania willdenowi]|uniref:target of Nesh-SH3-like isoform X2 n=1 Tax=Gouania willdenowi TaxID=441366 RepID=UPI0010568CDC|nr:target of Nesh-SH3-like isoform X2 [Gouania willdenowi]